MTPLEERNLLIYHLNAVQNLIHGTPKERDIRWDDYSVALSEMLAMSNVMIHGISQIKRNENERDEIIHGIQASADNMVRTMRSAQDTLDHLRPSSIAGTNLFYATEESAMDGLLDIQRIMESCKREIDAMEQQGKARSSALQKVSTIFGDVAEQANNIYTYSIHQSMQESQQFILSHMDSKTFLPRGGMTVVLAPNFASFGKNAHVVHFPEGSVLKGHPESPSCYQLYRDTRQPKHVIMVGILPNGVVRIQEKNHAERFEKHSGISASISEHANFEVLSWNEAEKEWPDFGFHAPQTDETVFAGPAPVADDTKRQNDIDDTVSTTIHHI